jgi:hypothetical protein
MDQDQVWYATREDVRSALSSASTARPDAQIDRAIETGSRAVDDLCQRSFAPALATRYFDWPNPQRARSWRLWLDRNEVISAQQVTTRRSRHPRHGLLPGAREPSGPPYNRIETRLDRPRRSTPAVPTSAPSPSPACSGTATTPSRSGRSPRTSPARPRRSISVTAPSLIGVGAVIRAGAERMVVTDKTIGDTGQVVQTPLAAKKDAVLVDVQDGTAYRAGDVIQLGGERMLVRSVAANQLTVDRAYDSTVLDSHSGTAIWAATVLTVARGVLGTTAATAAAAPR